MKKIINAPGDIVPEMIAGLVASYPQYLKQIPETTAVVRNDAAFKQKKKVGVISGGGSGHEPLHAGYVGQGMLDAAVAGQVFTSPTPDQIYAAIKAVDQGEGVLMIVKNYSGDVMNFDMAKDLASVDDIKVESVVVDDDVAVKDSLYTQGRRGVAGTIFVEKIIGAAAEAGLSLDELKKLGDAVVKNTKSFAVALHAATVPEVGKPGFDLKPDEIEFGVGIHNEPGTGQEKLPTSKALAKQLIGKLTVEFKDPKAHAYAVLVNGMGATPPSPQYPLMGALLTHPHAPGLKADFTKAGNYVTSLDMAGISLTMLALDDPQWLNYLNASAHTVGWGDTDVKR